MICVDSKNPRLPDTLQMISPYLVDIPVRSEFENTEFFLFLGTTTELQNCFNDDY